MSYLKNVEWSEEFGGAQGQSNMKCLVKVLTTKPIVDE